MRKRMTRRRSALCWTALAVALILSWGVVKDYGFTPWQARRRGWALTEREGMEKVVALERTEHRYVEVIGGNDYERWMLFANDEWMALAEEWFRLNDGWGLGTYAWKECTPESAQILPECTLWTDRYYYFWESGLLYFRADGVSGEVAGFSLAEAIVDPDGTVHYGLSDELLKKIDLRGRTRISREELCYDSRGHAYGMFSYYIKDAAYDDELSRKRWYLRVELTDGGERVVPIHTEQVIRTGSDGTGSWRSG